MAELWLNYQDTDPREHGRLGKRAWSRLHWLAAALLVALSMQLHFWRPNPAFALLALVPTALALVALAVARLFHVPITDFLGGLVYRDRFFLFLFHAMLFVSPRFLGLPVWMFGLALVQVALCFQAISPITFARILGIGLVMAIVSALFPPYPPLWLLGAWGLSVVVYLRAHHVAFRLLRHSRGAGTPVGAALWESTRSIAPPVLVATAAALAAALLWDGDIRQIVLAGTQPGPVAVLPVEQQDGLLLDLLILAALIGLALVALAWFEKFLRFEKKPGADDSPEDLAVGESTRGREGPAEAPEREPEGADPRGRVLRRFRKMALALGKAGLGRRPSETPAEYAARLASPPVAEPGLSGRIGVFNRACYSSGEISEQDASLFEQAAGAAEELAGQREALAAALRSAEARDGAG